VHVMKKLIILLQKMLTKRNHKIYSMWYKVFDQSLTFFWKYAYTAHVVSKLNLQQCKIDYAKRLLFYSCSFLQASIPAKELVTHITSLLMVNTSIFKEHAYTHL